MLVDWRKGNSKSERATWEISKPQKSRTQKTNIVGGESKRKTISDIKRLGRPSGYETKNWNLGAEKRDVESDGNLEDNLKYLRHIKP